MKVHFGVDHHDRLVLTYDEIAYGSGSINEAFFKWFHEGLSHDRDNFVMYMFNGGDIDQPYRFDKAVYKKDDNYNLEDCVKDAMILFEDFNCVQNIYFILMNKKWYTCNENTHYMLIPAIGKYTDLTNL